MNLLLLQEKEYVQKGFRLRLWVVVLRLITIASVIGIVLLLPAYFLLEADMIQIRTETSKAQLKHTGTAKNITALPKEIDYKVVLMSQSLQDNPVSDLVLRIINLRPRTVAIQSVSVLKNQIVDNTRGIQVLLSGMADDRDGLVNFVDTLKSSKQFTSVNVPVSNFTKDKNVPFSISLFISYKQ